jgi:carboxyl-terminal processing protease
VLRPQPALTLGIQSPDGAQRQVDVATKFKQLARVTNLTGEDGGSDIWNLIRDEENQEDANRARSVEFSDQLLVLKIPEFFFSDSDVDKMIGRAKKYPNLIIDLRGNPGGSVDTLRRLVGGMFDKEVKMADRKGRKDSKPEVAKPNHNPYTGKLVVLVDSRSASASELFARIMQLEKRGTVIGDRSSGSVMESVHYDEKVGMDTVIFYGVSVTEWDLIMTDGKSLEHVGVTPDEVVVPSAKDMAANRDTVLAHAAETLGVKLSPEAAAKAFPYEWAPQ